MKKYTLLKTASTTAKKNGLHLFKDSLFKKPYLVDVDILNGENVPEEFKAYALSDLGKHYPTDFTMLFYDVTEAEKIVCKFYFKIFTIDTEERNNLYKILQCVKVEYCHYIIDAWSGERKTITEFEKTIGSDYMPERITIAI